METEENVKSEILTECEGRIVNDIIEYKRSKLVGKICKIRLNDYQKIDNDTYELIIDFISYFSLKFIFDSQYPIKPPSILFNTGNKIRNIFDEKGNILVETIKKENWNKGIWLSTLIFYIELLISRETKEDNRDNSPININNYNKYNIIKNEKYRKRKWKDYVNETNEYYIDNNCAHYTFENNIKRTKDYNSFFGFNQNLEGEK